MKKTLDVTIRDVTGRDGFQSLKEFIPSLKKLEILGAIGKAGVKNIEATSFVSPKSIPQLKDARELIPKLPKNGTQYSALVPNLIGAKNAIAAGIDELALVISATDNHNLANVRRSVSESVKDLDGIFAMAKEQKLFLNVMIAVSFGCPYQGDVSEKVLFDLVDRFANKGAQRIILADTTGMAIPKQVEKIVSKFQKDYPPIDLGLHFHNNRGTAMTNLYVALAAGATTFDTALGGIGGCPYVPQAAGNLPTEDVVYMLEEMGVHTGIDLELIIKAAQGLEQELGYTLPGQVMKSGPRDPARVKKICSFNCGQE
jgi:hydroxymethylglutaryl-CoA lyase